MSVKTSKVKAPLGMQTLTFYPIKTEPENALPTYDAAVDLGAAVKGYLTVTTASASISGDDITQLEDEIFTGGQVDTETTMNDLEVNSTLFGHTHSTEAGEVSNSKDRANPGGLAFVEPILLKDKSIVYRATCLYKTQAMPSSEKQEADTKKAGELNPKMNAVSFKVMETNTGAWRVRQDFETLDAAKQFISKTFSPET